MEGQWHPHVLPIKYYIGVFLALLVLTALTTGVAFVDLGVWNTPIALLIAIFKASLVITIFMHLKWSNYLNRIVLVFSMIWLAILISMTLADNFSRDWTPVPQSWHETQATAPAPTAIPPQTTGNQ
jgi:cytochrome c oxidase subunit IV